MSGSLGQLYRAYQETKQPATRNRNRMTTLFFSLLLAHDPANSTSHVALTPWSEAGSYGSDALSRLAAAHNACQYSQAAGGGGGEVKVTKYLSQAAKFGLEMAELYWRGEKRRGLRGRLT